MSSLIERIAFIQHAACMPDKNQQPAGSLRVVEQVLDRQGYPIEVEDGGYDDVQPVGVFTIQYQDGLQHVGSGRFVAGEKNGQIWLSQAEVRQGYLESSNADLATELGKVIEAQRAYSYALRMMTTADEVETTVVNLAN